VIHARNALVSAAIALLCGCQTMGGAYDRVFGSSKPTIPDLAQIKPTATARILWQANVGGAEKSVFFPAVVHGVVYAAGASGQIAGFDAATGNGVSRFDAGQRIAAGVGVGSGLILVGTDKGEVLAFNNQGRPVWKAQILGELLAPPEADQGVVVVRAGNNQIYGLTAADGKRRWVYQRATPSLSVRTHAGVVLNRGGVFAGFAGGRLVALALPNGAVGWEGVVALPRGATELERVADVTSLPAVDESQVCAVAFQGRIACFDLIRGTQRWARDVSSVAGLALDPRYVYVTDDKSAVLALDKTNGASIWHQDKLAGRRLSAPLSIGRHVIVGDVEGYVHVLSRDSGAFEARVPTDGSAIAAAPVALDRTSFVVQTENGGVFAITVQ
jgi:outer membrane protein assembly factor BamB